MTGTEEDNISSASKHETKLCGYYAHIYGYDSYSQLDSMVQPLLNKVLYTPTKNLYLYHKKNTASIHPVTHL